jgi:hypothetical protein
MKFVHISCISRSQATHLLGSDRHTFESQNIAISLCLGELINRDFLKSTRQLSLIWHSLLSFKGENSRESWNLKRGGAKKHRGFAWQHIERHSLQSSSVEKDFRGLGT